MRRCVIFILAAAMILCACAAGKQTDTEAHAGVYSAGFGAAVLAVPQGSDEPLYIAGYHSGWEISGVRDEQQARAIWLDDGLTSILLIAVDCVGLGSDTVAEIRQRLDGFCRETGCDSINVVATHTHAGIDTLGLWGPMGIDGKNEAFMNTVIAGAVAAAEAAYADRTTGRIVYSETPTQGLQEDSRDPVSYDSNLYQLRFVPEDSSANGIRLLSFAAHAEALRGDNTLVSRDYPGVVCDIIMERTGDDVIFLPGAIGGLIMTPELTGESFEAEKNLQLTAQRIAEYALAETQKKELTANIGVSRVEFDTELDNTLFVYYKFLGILQNDVRRDLRGKYQLRTELTILRVGEVTLALLPGEIFPELVTGTGNQNDPKGLQEIAAAYSVEDLVIVGLANDEIGYILPPSDYLLDEELPYVKEAEGDHYEETNSVGKNCGADLAEAFERALEKMNEP